MVCSVTGKSECAIIRIGVGLQDELQEVNKEDVPRERVEDTALRNSCANWGLGEEVTVHHHMDRPIPQVILEEGEKAPTHSYNVEFGEKTGVSHPVKSSSDVQVDNEGIMASVQGLVPRGGHAQQDGIGRHIKAEAKLSVTDKTMLVKEGRDLVCDDCFECLTEDRQEGYRPVVARLCLFCLLMDSCHSRCLPAGGPLSGAEVVLEDDGGGSSQVSSTVLENVGRKHHLVPRSFWDQAMTVGDLLPLVLLK